MSPRSAQGRRIRHAAQDGKELRALLEADLAEAERKAWDSLARYKFFMFGYHAADVVKLSRRLGRRGNQFRELVRLAADRARSRK